MNYAVGGERKWQVQFDYFRLSRNNYVFKFLIAIFSYTHRIEFPNIFMDIRINMYTIKPIANFHMWLGNISREMTAFNENLLFHCFYQVARDRYSNLVVSGIVLKLQFILQDIRKWPRVNPVEGIIPNV